MSVSNIDRNSAASHCLDRFSGFIPCKMIFSRGLKFVWGVSLQALIKLTLALVSIKSLNLRNFAWSERISTKERLSFANKIFNFQTPKVPDFSLQPDIPCWRLLGALNFGTQRFSSSSGYCIAVWDIPPWGEILSYSNGKFLEACDFGQCLLLYEGFFPFGLNRNLYPCEVLFLVMQLLYMKH